MKPILHVMTALAVMGLAFWAYQENYKTQESQRHVRALQNQIGAAHARLGMLRAEWAYLNRPDRLAELAALNFDRLGLLPMTPEVFGHLGDVPMGIPDILPLGPITDPVSLAAETAAHAAANPGEEPL